MAEQLLDNQPFITDAETIQKFVDAGIDNHKQWQALGGFRIRF